MAELIETPFGEILCGHCGYSIVCDENGDMPDVCPECGETLDWDGMEDK